VPANFIFDKSGKLIYGEGNREFLSKKKLIFLLKNRGNIAPLWIENNFLTNGGCSRI
jgi:hypothetical protein